MMIRFNRRLSRTVSLYLFGLFGIWSCRDGGQQNLVSQAKTKTLEREIKNCADVVKSLEDLTDDDELKVTAAYSAQMGLARLGYGTEFTGEFDDQTWSAIRRFRERRGLKSGKGDKAFDCPTLEAIQEGASAMEAIESETWLPGQSANTDAWSDGYASAKGTWTIRNDKMANPFQTSHLVCYRPHMSCTEATATMSGRHLTLETEIHEIERWDEHEIVVKPKDAVCTRYVLRFNRAQKQVTGTRSALNRGPECAAVEKRELHLVLADGISVGEEQTKKFREIIRKTMYPQRRAAKLHQLLQ